MEQRNTAGYCAVDNLHTFTDELINSVDKTHQLIELTQHAREVRGPGRDIIEVEIWRYLDRLLFRCTQELLNNNVKAISLEHITNLPDSETNVQIRILSALYNYALSCMAYKAKSRDSFSGKRRGQAYGMLAHMAYHTDLPNIVEMALKDLKKKRETNQNIAIIFLATYYEIKMEPPESVVTALLSLVERTTSRCNAVGALNILVESGDICELEALDKIGTWKEKNDGYYF